MKNIIILLLPLFLNSCKNISNREINVDIDNSITITINEFDQIKTRFSELLKNYKYIKLDTHPEHIIGSIDKIIISEGLIYILDRHSAKSIFTFDLNGNFINQIKKLGKGPGEYLSINDFFIDSVNNSIFLFDNKAKRLIEYSLSGDYKKDYNLPEIYSRSFYFDCYTGKFLYYLGFKPQKIEAGSKVLNRYNLLFYNKKRKLYGKALNIKYIETEKRDFNFFNNYSGLSFVYGYTDKIFRIDIEDAIVEPVYTIDFGNHSLKKDKAFGKVGETSLNEYIRSKNADNGIHKMDYAFGVTNIIETDNYLYFNFIYGRRYYSCFYSKKTGEKIYDCCIEDDLNCFGSSLNLTTFNNKFVSVIDPYNFHRMISFKEKNFSKLECDVFKESNSEVYDLYEQTKIDDNPILFIYEINEF